MMRILVLSDSHGDFPSLKMAVENEKNADAIIFLGDGLNDLSHIENLIRTKPFIAVKGNCDGYLSPYPEKAVEIFGGKTVYCTHGYKEQVKFGLDKLKTNALYNDAEIALFGHTHVPFSSYENGLYLLNPGSVRQNSCGIVDITPQGIMCFHKKIVASY